mgnify:CR=1 FL=1
MTMELSSPPPPVHRLVKPRSAKDLQSCQYAFVLAICREPGRSQEELAKELCVNKSTVARNLNFLEEKGYIKREPLQSDKRQFSVYPTDKMLELYPKVCSVAYEWRRYLTEELSEEEITFLESVLERVSEKAQAYVDSKEAEK